VVQSTATNSRSSNPCDERRLCRQSDSQNRCDLDRKW
jgi:hypothetical protein